jgi:hypothetical protein
MTAKRCKGKGKSVPQHTYGGAGTRWCIAPTHSRPRHYVGVSGQHHTQAALYPWGKDPRYHCTGGWVGHRAGLDTEVRGKISYLCWWSYLDRQVVQSVARHYTDWATLALKSLWQVIKHGLNCMILSVSSKAPGGSSSSWLDRRTLVVSQSAFKVMVIFFSLSCNDLHAHITT